MKRMAERLNLRMKKLKLVHQINVAFGLSLLLVLSITGVMIHYVLMDHFIGTEQEGLRTLGASLTATLQQPPFAEGGHSHWEKASRLRLHILRSPAEYRPS